MTAASVEDVSSISQPLNVLGGALQRFSTDPMTGYFRDGYCRTDPSDRGEHTIAGVVTEQVHLSFVCKLSRVTVDAPVSFLTRSFLGYSVSRGNDLSTPHPPVFPGLTEGCRWCLCVARWKEALLAYRAGDISRNAVPKVVLNATHSSALRTVSLSDLREFAFDDSRGER